MDQSIKTIKIAVTGPEASGKSYTSEYLARIFDGWVVPEFAREYLNYLDRAYNYQDVVNIAKGQMDVEQKVMADALKEHIDFVFFDSELINTRIWMDEKFGECEPFVLDAIQESDYDHYLLMKPDIEWEPDPLRENPYDRDRLFELHIQHLNFFQKSFTVIEGDRDQRLKMAIAVVKTLKA